MRDLTYVMVLAATLACGGCKKSGWVAGKWLLIDQDGKPGVCHEFKKDKSKSFLVYTGTQCTGTTDPLLSGKYQLKEENKLAIQRGEDEQAHLVLITEKTDEYFVASGAISGKMYRVDEKGVGPLLDKLDEEGVIKLKPLPLNRGCKHLGLKLKTIKALPSEPHPRMIRNKDKGLEYHVDKATGDPKIQKIVYSLNLDVIEWISFHMAPEAFSGPGPQALLEAVVGKPADAITTGSGEKRQQIVMWRAYCEDLRGAKNKDVDLTLFITPAQQRGTYYVSENIVSGIWEELKRAAKDSETEEEEGAGEASTPTKAATPAKAAPPPPPPKPAPAPPPPQATPAPKPKPAPTPSPAPKPDDDDI